MGGGCTRPPVGTGTYSGGSKGSLVSVTITDQGINCTNPPTVTPTAVMGPTPTGQTFTAVLSPALGTTIDYGGNITTEDTVSAHVFQGKGGPPTAATNTTCAPGATADFAGGAATDSSGTLRVTTASSAISAQCVGFVTVTFTGTGFATAPNCVFSPANNHAAGIAIVPNQTANEYLGIYITTTTTNFTLSLGYTPLPANTAYHWSYVCNE